MSVARLRCLPAVPYILAGVLAGLALAVQLLIRPLTEPDSYEVFLGAVALSALWGGISSGLFTLLLEGLFRLYFFLPPYYSIDFENRSVIVRLLLFLAIGTVICLIGGALRGSRETLSITLTSIGDAVIATDDKERIKFMNPVAEDLSGWREQEAAGKPLQEVLLLVDEETRSPLVNPVTRVIRDKSVIRLTNHTRLISRDGTAIPIEDSASPIHDAAGKTRGAIMVFHDVTERARVEKALRASEERFELFMRNLGGMAFIKDGEGRYVYINEFGDQLGRRMGVDWMNHKDEEILPADTAAQFRESDERVITSGKPLQTVEITRDERGPRYWLVNRFPIAAAEGRDRLIGGIALEITQQKHLEEQVRQAQKMEAVGRLAGGVAHDFNNLLTIINGYSNLMAAQLAESDPFRTGIEEIMKAGERAASLTNQLLVFSRRQMLQPKTLDLNALVADIEKMLRRLIGEDIELVTILDPALYRTKGDLGQIEQVIMNLVINARDAMPHGGKLTIETHNVDLEEANTRQAVSGPYVMLKVSDTGIGMDEATQSHIFEPFFTTKERGKGTGLGLSTTYAIVNQANGCIDVSSEPGHGTTFKLFFPRAPVEAESEKLRESTSTSTRGSETILVVEDEPGVREFLRSALLGQGYKVLVAGEAEEALRLCGEKQGSVDLLLTDVVMPQMSGPQLAEEAVRLSPGIKVLYVSGYTDEAIVRHGIAEAGLAFLQKPFTPEALARKIREVLDTDA